MSNMWMKSYFPSLKSNARKKSLVKIFKLDTNRIRKYQ